MMKAMQYIKQFILVNRRTLIGLLLGAVLGYLYWALYGSRWGTYYLSSECWFICLVSALTGGLLLSLSEISE